MNGISKENGVTNEGATGKGDRITKRPEQADERSQGAGRRTLRSVAESQMTARSIGGIRVTTRHPRRARSAHVRTSQFRTSTSTRNALPVESSGANCRRSSFPTGLVVPICPLRTRYPIVVGQVGDRVPSPSSGGGPLEWERKRGNVDLLGNGALLLRSHPFLERLGRRRWAGGGCRRRGTPVGAFGGPWWRERCCVN